VKLKQIRAVSVAIPREPPRTKPWREGWNTRAPRALPINKYPEFSRELGRIPGAQTQVDIWVQAIAEDGTYGLGVCSFGEPVAAIVDYVFAPLLEGRDALATELHNDLMWRAAQPAGATGHASVAQSGIDLALWDLRGKLLDQPVYRLLGGPVRDRIKCYATSDDLDWSLALGFEAFKVSNPVHYDAGTEGLNQLEAKIAEARETVGDDAELAFNPVMGFNVDFTVRLAERLRAYDLRWLEEPLPPWDLEGQVELRRRIPFMPIATGEHHHGRHAFRQLVERRAVDVIQPDMKWCGGLTEALKAYTLAEAAGLQTIPHFGANTPWGQHFSIAMPEAPLAEFWLGSDPGVPLMEVAQFPGVPVPDGGFVTPSDAPGFGFEIREEWIAPWDHTAAGRD
jgi:L-rhamnonate dehydratase